MPKQRNSPNPPHKGYKMSSSERKRIRQREIDEAKERGDNTLGQRYRASPATYEQRERNKLKRSGYQ